MLLEMEEAKGTLLYQPRKLSEIVADIISGAELPFYKHCNAIGCDECMLTVTKDGFCGERTFECVRCADIVHYNRLFIVCGVCNRHLCVNCSAELGIGGGQLRCNRNYLGVKQCVYNFDVERIQFNAGEMLTALNSGGLPLPIVVEDEYHNASGTLIAIDTVLASTIYTFSCILNGFPGDQCCAEPVYFYIIIEIYCNTGACVIDLIAPCPEDNIVMNLDRETIIEIYTQPLAFVKRRCIECDLIICRGYMCGYCNEFVEPTSCINRYSDDLEIKSSTHKLGPIDVADLENI
jgi:hypothetical protein